MTTVRVTHDPSPGIDPHAVLPDTCLKAVDADHLCCLPRRHLGRCLPFARWAQRDVSPTNPRWVPPQRTGGGR